MAVAPAPAPAPAGPAGAPPMPPDMAAPPAEAPVEEEPVVVATILKNADGSFTLEGGDMAAPDMAAPPGGPPGAPGAEMGMEGAAPMEAPAGQDFAGDEAGIGELMTAVLNLVDPENAEGPAAQANFEEGFKGEEVEPAEPIKPAM